MSDVKQRNREQMPNVAALIDEFRKVNPDIDFKVIYAEDFVTGVTVGTKPDDSNSFTIPPNYFPTATTETPKKGKRK